MNRTCDVPIIGWQVCFYFTLVSLRVFLYIYCISVKLAKCAMVTLLGFLMPLFVAMTIVGTILYRRMHSTEPECVSLDKLFDLSLILTV